MGFAPEWLERQSPAFHECARWPGHPASINWRPRIRADLRGVPTQDLLDLWVQEATDAGRDPWYALHRPEMPVQAATVLPDSFVLGT